MSRSITALQRPTPASSPSSAPTLAALSDWLTRAEWTQQALCARRDPDELFVTGAAQRDAARICAGCPVKTECLADALDSQAEFGVWGGLTERQRRAVLRRNPDVASWRDVLLSARDAAIERTAG